MGVKEGKLFHARDSRAVLREVFNRRESNLEFLSLAELDIRDARFPSLCHKREETLVFNIAGPSTVDVEGIRHELAHYDVLYISKGAEYAVEAGDEAAHLYLYRALADKEHPVRHMSWKSIKNDPERLRLLPRKKVHLMFDVGEEADRFMAGYTFYEDHARAWPPHNHTDQEECYSFIEGSGAMQVYEDDERTTFVKRVEVGSHVTIPLMNYHPVFSHEEPLCFIWCIAGERYWVGDRNRSFMDGSVSRLTT
ncbi:MAG: 5-deoxy-glucuronate isomerase [Spirochaetes bacterium]|nr:5-deoxy-glucuronate isomerase [Spirochaetota bacterium]